MVISIMYSLYYVAAKLQSIHHGRGPDISPAASEAYAKSICTMPNLQTLELQYVNVADDFFLALCTSAAGSKVYVSSLLHFVSNAW